MKLNWAGFFLNVISFTKRVFLMNQLSDRLQEIFLLSVFLNKFFRNILSDIH